MTKVLRIVLSVCITLITLSTVSLYAGENYDKAVAAFNANKYTEAGDYCDKAIAANEPEKLEAMVLAIYNCDYNADKKKGLKYLREILKSAENPGPYYFGILYSGLIEGTPIYEREELFEIFTDLYESPKIDGNIRVHLCEFFNDYYKFKNKFSKAEKYSKLSGAIYDWQAVGSFENISESGFDKNYYPINNPEPGSRFNDKEGAQIEWFDIVKPKCGLWINLQKYFITNNSIIYTQTFCESPSDRTAQIRVGTSGSLRVWINDVEVINVDEERNNGLDTYIANIKLNKGVNRVLLQIGASEINRSNFSARITDESGNPQEDLKFTTRYSAYTKGEQKTYELVSTTVERDLRKMLEQKPNSLVYKYMLANVLLYSQRNNEAKKILKSIEAIEPNCSFLLTKLLVLYYTSNNREDQSLVLEKIKEKAPNHYIALESAIQENLDKEKFEVVSGLIDKYQENVFKKPDAYNYRIKLYIAEKKERELLSLIDLAYSKYPYDEELFGMKLILELRGKNNISGSISLLKDYLSDYLDFKFYNALGDIYLSKGDIEGYIDINLDLAKQFPEDVTFPYQIANKYFDMGDYNNAVIYYKKCVELAPSVAIYHHELGNAYKAIGENTQAKRSYLKCLALNPYHFTVREKLRNLESKKSAFDYFTEPDLQALYNTSLKEKSPDGENCWVLLSRADKVVYTGGAFEEKNYVLIKALNAEGRDALKEKSIPVFANQYATIEKAEVFKKNGTKIKAEVHDNDIVFTSLEEGDAIAISYKIQNYQFGSLSAYFWDSKPFAFGYPCKSIKYSILAAKEAKFEYKMLNSSMQPTVKPIDEYNLYVWESNDIEGGQHEPYMAESCDYAPYLFVSSMPNWNFIAKWYSDLSKAKTKPDYDLNEVVSELKAKPGLNTELDKAKAIYEYIVKNVRYSYVPFRQSGIIPQKASRVINSKMGDCKDVSTLFVALSRQMGLKANVVLVSTRDNGLNALPLPSIDFNHAIATVVADGKKYFIEMTSDKLPFNTVGSSLKNALALEIVTSDSAKLISLDPEFKVPNYIERECYVDFTGETMNMKVRTLRSGSEAADSRYNYVGVKEDERRKTFTRSLSASFRNLKFGKLEISSDLTTLSDTLSYYYDFSVPNAFTSIGDLKAIATPLIDYMQNADVFSAETRIAPMDLIRFFDKDYEAETITIKYPENKTLKNVPESVAIDSPMGTYELKFEENENELIVHRKLSYKKLFVPVSDYPAMRDFVNKVLKADLTQIAFTQN